MARVVGLGPGTLIAVGGGEDKRGAMAILRRALEHAPPAARVALLPTASREPLWASELHAEAFRALGAGTVDVVDVRTRDDAQQDALVERLRLADLIYMTGGDQARLAHTLQGTAAMAAMREKLAAGGAVGGTSAGAAALCGVMIAEGESGLRKGHVRLAEGLDLLPHAIVDTHFVERGRFARLIEAVATHPRLLGIGLAEDTAIVVRGQDVEVVGNGSVVVLDAREMRESNVGDAGAEEPVNVERVILHTYSGGHVFSLDPPAAPAVARRGKART